MIEAFQSEGAAVILLGVRGGVIADGYSEAYEELARDTGSAYVPNVLAGLIGTPELMADTVHPNQQGYVIIADRVEPVVRELDEGT
jgi:acyl-CoA hydrolase